MRLLRTSLSLWTLRASFLFFAGCSFLGPQTYQDGATPDARSGGDVAVPDAPAEDANIGGATFPRCENDPGAVMAPVPDGAGGFRCIRTGALGGGDTMWPTTDSSEMPVVFVNAGADAGGSGSRTSPFRTIVEALQHDPPAATIVLAAGATHSISSPLAVRRRVSILGAGSGAAGSNVRNETTDTAFDVSSASGLVQLRGFRIAADRTAMSTHVRVGSDARVVIDDVHFTGAQSAIDLRANSSAALDAVTVVDTSGDGVRVGAQSDATLRGVLISGAGAHGVLVEGGHLSFVESRVAGAARGGIVLTGNGGTVADRLDRVALIDNVGVGLAVSGAGRLTQVFMSGVLGTNVPAGGGAGGVGMFVTSGAHLIVDADRTGAGQRGRGTYVIGNATLGVLASGSSTRLDAHALRVFANRGPGMFIQGAVGPTVIVESEFRENPVFGLGIVGGFDNVSLQCNGFLTAIGGDARWNGMTITAGDGLWVASDAPTTMNDLRNNDFESNFRFGAFFFNVSATLAGGSFRANGFPTGVYGSSTAASIGATVADQRQQPMSPGRLPSGMERAEEPPL